MKSFFKSLLTVLIFLAGILLELSLSSGIVWAQVDASFYGTQTNEVGLKLNCPIMLSPSESGMVSATITNTLNEEVLPVVTAEISGTQSTRQTLLLAPRETQVLQWPVDPSNVIYGRLILVNVNQARYRDLDAHQSFCGILVFNLFNLKGNATLVLIIISSLALILISGILWWHTHTPLDDFAEQTLKACAALAVVTTLALLTALPRWWGLTLILDALAVIMISVLFTDFVLFPKRGRN